MSAKKVQYADRSDKRDEMIRANKGADLPGLEVGPSSVLRQKFCSCSAAGETPVKSLPDDYLKSYRSPSILSEFSDTLPIAPKQSDGRIASRLLDLFTDILFESPFLAVPWKPYKTAQISIRKEKVIL